jgi:hypothetical protein
LKADGSVDTNTYLTSASLNGYATQNWVNDKGYLTSSGLTGYATETWVTNKGYTTNTGTVTSVGLSVPTGFSVGNSPVTGSGTLTLSFADGYSLPTTVKQTNWDTAYGWGNHASAGYLPLTAGYDKQLTGILYANKPIGIKGTFDNNVVPTEVQGVAYLAYNSSSKSLDFIFN